MDPRVGRFLGMDSYSGRDMDPASLHKYTYVHNLPVAAVDPTGKFPSGLVSVTFVGYAINTAFYIGAFATGGTSALAGAIVEDLAFMLIPGGGISKAGIKIAQIFNRARKFKIGYAASGPVLAHNLRVFGRYGPNNWPAHHIVPGGVRGPGGFSTANLHGIFQRSGVDINSPINGIFLEPAVHARIHTARYYTLLEQRLLSAERATGKDGVRQELQIIYEEIASGIFP